MSEQQLTEAERRALHDGVCPRHRDTAPDVYVCGPCEAAGDAVVARIKADAYAAGLAAAPGQGRCGDEGPRLAGSGAARVLCRLRYGHGGWHKGDDGSEWSRPFDTTNPTAGEQRHGRECAAGITNGAARCQCATPDAGDVDLRAAAETIAKAATSLAEWRDGGWGVQAGRIDAVEAVLTALLDDARREGGAKALTDAAYDWDDADVFPGEEPAWLRDRARIAREPR